MSHVARMRLLARSWIGTILLPVIGGTSCESTAPGTGGSPGGLTLVTATTGTQPDGNGYAIMVDGRWRGSIGPDDSLTLGDVGAGSHAVELSDIEFNCATLGEFTRTVSVAADAETVVEYSVACDALARSRIGFVRDPSTAPAPEIFLMNADGSELTSLTASVGAAYTWASFPSVRWSADGNRLAFTRSDGGLYATTGEETDVVQLAPGGVSPIWSADGRKVAFLGIEPGTLGQACCRDIFIAESDGTRVTQVTDGLILSFYDFAANGSLLVHPDDEVTTRALVFVRPDGTGRRELAPPGIGSFQSPVLSPDGTRVAYFAYPDEQGSNGPRYEVYVSPTDGTQDAVNVSNNPGTDWGPVWSRDGTRVAFVSSTEMDPLSPGSIHVVNADGTGQVALSPADMLVLAPAWSPDGTRIAYAGLAGDQWHIFVANADGSGRADITPNSESLWPIWTGR